jgi:hypothetical protein
MKYILLVCLLIHVAFAGLGGSGGDGWGSNGPYAKNNYAGAGYQGKHQADKLKSAKYAKNSVGAKQLSNHFKNLRVKAYLANVKKANRRHKASDAAHKVAKKNFGNNLNKRNSAIKFRKNKALKNIRFNKLKKKQNMMHANLKKGNRVHKNRLNRKNANMKKVNNFAKHNEFDDNSDEDSGGFHGSSGGGPNHVTHRKHGQQHAFGNKMMMSKYNQLNSANLGKNGFWNQNKGVNQKYLDRTNAKMKNKRDNIAFAAKKNALNKNQHYNAYAAMSKKKKVAGRRSAYKAQKAMKSKAAKAGAKKRASYKKRNNVGAATRNAHTYGNQYRRKKAIAGMN